jgi:hypothetical protein
MKLEGHSAPIRELGKTGREISEYLPESAAAHGHGAGGGGGGVEGDEADVLVRRGRGTQSGAERGYERYGGRVSTRAGNEGKE